MNFLEQLVAEWYGYRGYFVRTNIHFGKRVRGGWEGEMDVVAYKPQEKTLIHLETSGDADSWNQRRERFRKKFEAAARHYEKVFDFEFERVRKVAIVGFVRPKGSIGLGGDIELVTIPEMMIEITKEMRRLKPTNIAIPEVYPLLRAIQFAAWFGTSECDD